MRTMAALAGGLVFLVLATTGRAQEPVSAQLTLVQSFEQEQDVIGQDLEGLMSEGATAAEIDAWMTQNSAVFQAQLTLARQLSAQAFLEPMDLLTGVVIPDDASQEMSDFLVAQGTLANNFAAIHNQLVDSVGDNPTVAQVESLGTAETSQFEQENGAALAAQTQRAKDLAEAASHQVLELPPPASIPVGTSSAMRAFLLLQNQVAREQITVHNQSCTGTMAQQDAAMAQWEAQHEGEIAQLSQLAVSRSSSTTSTAPTQD